MDEERIVIGDPRPALSREQKVGLGFVIACGIGTLVLGGFYLWHHVAIPFVVNYEGPQVSLSGDSADAAAIAKAKATDTDGDGISDYDEQNIYGTSAYLADSDSDGLSDKVEIESGQDPNCALGAQCESTASDQSAVENTSAAGTFIDGLNEPAPPVAPNVGGADTVTSSQETQALDANAVAQLQNLPTDQIRQLLISSGADQAKVNALSDDEVRSLYEQILQSLSSGSN